MDDPKNEDIKLILNRLEHEFAIKKQKFHSNSNSYYRQNAYSKIIVEDELIQQLKDISDLKKRITELSNYILDKESKGSDFQYAKRF